MAKSDIVRWVREYLDNENWKYRYVEDKGRIELGMNLPCKLKSIDMKVLFNDNGATVLGICPMNAGKDERNAVMEYITRANYGLRNGNFEMDLSDGEVRYKCYLNAKGSRPSDGQIEDALMIPPAMFKKYGDGLAALLMGFSDPKTEIEKAEA